MSLLGSHGPREFVVGLVFGGLEDVVDLSITFPSAMNNRLRTGADKG